MAVSSYCFGYKYVVNKRQQDKGKLPGIFQVYPIGILERGYAPDCLTGKRG